MSPATSDSTARRLLLRHPPGLSPDDAQALRSALEQAVHQQQALAGRQPAIVPVHDLAVDAEGYWQEEPADSRSLEAVLAEDAPLDERRVASLGVQLCDALHKACYPPDGLPRPHGAIRPPCIRVTGDRLQLSDLGIATALIDTLGSAAPREELDLLAPYVARELWLRAGNLGELRDMFAVGVILYELATGTHPYGVDRRDFNDCEQRILTAEPRPARDARPELSESFSNIIDRAISRREEDRFPLLAELRDALLPLAGATALELTAAVPAEACTLDLREGAAQADATGVATLMMRFVTAVAEGSGLLSTQQLGVELGDLHWSDDTTTCTATARVTSPPTVTTPATADITIRKTDTALCIDDPADCQRRLLDAIQPAVLAAQRAALEQTIKPLADGPFPAARSTTDLEHAVPATLLTITCLPEPAPASIELSLVWNADRGTWDEREPGSLASAAVDVARDAVLEAIQRRVRRVADVLMANESALRWTVAAETPAAEGVPASIPLTVRLDWQPDTESGKNLAEFALSYPLDDEQTLDRHLRRAERELGKLQSAAPAAAGAAGRPRWPVYVAPLAGVALVAVVLVAWIVWPRGGNGTSGGGQGGPTTRNTPLASGDSNQPPVPNGGSGTPTTSSGGGTVAEPNKTTGPSAAERERIAALQASFDAQVQRLRDQTANPASLTASTYRTLLATLLDHFEPDRDDLTSPQQTELAKLRDTLDALETFQARVTTARQSPSFESLSGAATALPAAMAWPDRTPATIEADVNDVIHALDLAAARQKAGDAWGLGYFLNRAHLAAETLAGATGIAAPLPDAVTQFRQELAEQRRQALEPAFAQADAWLSEKGEAPATPAEHFQQTATAGEARAQLDALGLYFPSQVLDMLGFGIHGTTPAPESEPSEGVSSTLDGVLRWDDLDAAQQQTVKQLLAWVLTTLSVTPANAQETVSIPLSCLAPADGPNGAPVWIGRTEVTVDDYRGLLGTLPNTDADMAARGDNPVGYVTQDDTGSFCSKLYDAAGIESLVIRLPYAQEWERACLAGRGHLLDAMPDLRHYDAQSGALTLAIDRANFDSRERDPTMVSHEDGFAGFAPVGSYAPNAWQLDDILGNVRELVKVDVNRLEGRGSGFGLSVEPSDLTRDPFQREPQTSGLRPLEDVGFRIVVQWLE